MPLSRSPPRFYGSESIETLLFTYGLFELFDTAGVHLALSSVTFRPGAKGLNFSAVMVFFLSRVCAAGGVSIDGLPLCYALSSR